MSNELADALNSVRTRLRGEPAPGVWRGVTIRSLRPPHTVLRFTFGTANPPKLSGGVGGWDAVARPRRVAITEYTGTTPFKLELDLMADGYLSDTSVDQICNELVKMARPVGKDPEPPPVHLEGPGVTSNLGWVITDIAWTGEERNRAGVRVRAAMTVTLLQWVPADVTVGAGGSPAAQAINRKYGSSVLLEEQAVPTAAAFEAAPPLGFPSAGGGGVIGSLGLGGTPIATATHTYTVRAGDTLSGIAARELGSAAQWTVIADLNGIRDPRTIQAGQVLTLPGNPRPNIGLGGTPLGIIGGGISQGESGGLGANLLKGL